MKLQKIYCTILLLISYQINYSQTSYDKTLYDSFDKAIGLKNLGINNGTIHFDTYRIFDKTHRYHVTDKYFPGNVFYDGQQYTAQNLKYDIFKDVLIAKINEPNNSLGINLIQAKTEWFTFSNKKFVNLNFNNKDLGIAKGYYEEYKADSKVSLYIKYHKDQIEVLTQEGVFYKYLTTNEFLIKYNGSLSRINDPKVLARLFPAYEKSINDYAYVNRDTQKSDAVEFMKIMVDYVNNLLLKETR